MREIYHVEGVEVELISKTVAKVEGIEVTGKDRIELLGKIGEVLREEYAASSGSIFGFYDVVDLR